MSAHLIKRWFARILREPMTKKRVSLQNAHMVNVAKNKLLWTIVLAFVLACGFYANRVGAYPSSVASQASAAATSTVSYLNPGTGTTTYQLDSPTYGYPPTGKVASMMGIDSSSLYLLFNASSSNSILAWQIQYSNNGSDWYGESESYVPQGFATASTTAGAAIVEASSTVTHLWQVSAAGFNYKVVSLPTTPALHERIVFTMPAGSAPGALYNEVDLKQNPSTP